MPKIPKDFIKRPSIAQVLQQTINEFNYEEKKAIYLYCFINLPLAEIAEQTELSVPHVECALTLYSEKLAFKLGVFKKAVPYNADDLLSIEEMLELEKDAN